MVRQPVPCPVPSEMERCRIAEDAAEKAADAALRKMFAILGVDLNVPSEVEAFRRDLRLASVLRRAADKSVLAVVTTMATALVAATIYGIVEKIKSGG